VQASEFQQGHILYGPYHAGRQSVPELRTLSEITRKVERRLARERSGFPYDRSQNAGAREDERSLWSPACDWGTVLSSFSSTKLTDTVANSARTASCDMAWMPTIPKRSAGSTWRLR